MIERVRRLLQPAPRVHPVVRLDYTVRWTTYPLFALLFLSHLHHIGRLTAPVIAYLLVYLLVTPHLMYFLASRSRDSKRAELRNLSVDSLIIGTWLPLLEFSLWPCAVAVYGVHAGNLSVGGLRFAVWNVLVILLGVLAMLPLAGYRFEPGSSLLITIGSMVVLFVYISVYALHSHLQSKRVVHGMRRIREQSQELEYARAAAEEARRAAEQANRAKSRFLANMSHELRTPLNAIIGYSEMLMEESGDAGTSAMVSDLEKIRGAGRHLLGLINEVLDLSKIEAGRMELHLERFDARALVDDVVATVGPLTARNGNRLDVDAAPALGTMHADVTKLRQILLNLLGNAAKFTERGTIALTARRESAPGGDRIVFTVRDSGIGMTGEQLDRLFQPFVQADASTTRKYGGTGLGLTISRRFCEMMGGEISVESRSGAGTTFTVRLPAEVKERPVRAVTGELPGLGTAPVPARRGSGPLVLVIDDDADARGLLERLLVKEGYRVALAAGAADGLAQARAERPDLITLDVLMPEHDGWSVLATLRADPALAGIPVLVLSVTDDAGQARELGAVAHIRKPVSRDRFVREVRDALATRVG